VSFDTSRQYWAAAFGVLGLFAILVGSSAIPPVTDLPQHLAQIRLLNELVGLESAYFDRGGYQVNWFSPNTLVYFLLWGLERAFGPIEAGRLLLYILISSSALSLIALAWARRRDLTHAMLASIFLLNLSFYWGFINFIIGWVFFVAFIVYFSKERLVTGGIKRQVAAFLFFVVLFMSHALWLLMAMAWYAFGVLWHASRKEIDIRGVLVRAIPALPIVIYSLVWLPGLQGALVAEGYQVEPVWSTSLWERVGPSGIPDFLLGGLQGGIEGFIVAISVAWLLLGLYTNRQNLSKTIDNGLIACASMLWGAFLVLPDLFMNTMAFSLRWAAPAMMVTVMALPAPRSPGALRLLPPLLFAAFVLVSAMNWRAFEREELTGLMGSLSSVPAGKRVMWLSYGYSPRFKHPLFIQIGALSQAITGSEPNFSFAELGTGIVSTTKPRNGGWTRDLEWFPERVRADDMARFDYVLVYGGDALHQAFAGEFGMEAVSDVGKFRLYHARSDD